MEDCLKNRNRQLRQVPFKVLTTGLAPAIIAATTSRRNPSITAKDDLRSRNASRQPFDKNFLPAFARLATKSMQSGGGRIKGLLVLLIDGAIWVLWRKEF